MGPQEEFHEFDRNDSWGVIYQVSVYVREIEVCSTLSESQQTPHTRLSLKSYLTNISVDWTKSDMASKL